MLRMMFRWFMSRYWSETSEEKREGGVQAGAGGGHRQGEQERAVSSKMRQRLAGVNGAEAQGRAG